SFTLMQLRIRRRMIGPDALRDIVLDRVDQDGPVGGELEPVPARRFFRYECAAALVAMQQAFLAQDIDGLAHGDPRHLELALELDQGGYFRAGLPWPAFEARPHPRRDLDIEGNTAAVVCLQELGHGRCHQVVWT